MSNLSNLLLCYILFLRSLYVRLMIATLLTCVSNIFYPFCTSHICNCYKYSAQVSIWYYWEEVFSLIISIPKSVLHFNRRKIARNIMKNKRNYTRTTLQKVCVQPLGAYHNLMPRELVFLDGRARINLTLPYFP